MSQLPPPGFGQPLPQHAPHPGFSYSGPAQPFPANPAASYPGHAQPGASYPGPEIPAASYPGQPQPIQPQPVAHPVPPHPTRPEIRVAAIRQHARRVILPSLILIGASGVIGYCFRGLREPGDWLLWGILAGAIALLFGFVPILAWMRNRYQITTVRTISRKGLFRSAKREIAHHQVVKVEMKRNPWQALFGSGTVRLTEVSGRVFEVKDVPNAVTVTQALRELTGNINRHEEQTDTQTSQH